MSFALTAAVTAGKVDSVKGIRSRFIHGILPLLLFLSFNALGADKIKSAVELERILVGKSFTMRQAQNVAAKQYYKVGTNEFLCRHKLTGLFPNRQPLTDCSTERVWIRVKRRTASDKWRSERG